MNNVHCTPCSLRNRKTYFYSKPICLSFQELRVTLNWIVDPFTQVKSTKHMVTNPKQSRIWVHFPNNFFKFLDEIEAAAICFVMERGLRERVSKTPEYAYMYR